MNYTKPSVTLLGNARTLIERNAQGVKQSTISKDSEMDLHFPPAYDLDE